MIRFQVRVRPTLVKMEGLVQSVVVATAAPVTTTGAVPYAARVSSRSGFNNGTRIV